MLNAETMVEAGYKIYRAPVGTAYKDEESERNHANTRLIVGAETQGPEDDDDVPWTIIKPEHIVKTVDQ